MNLLPKDPAFFEYLQEQCRTICRAISILTEGVGSPAKRIDIEQLSSLELTGDELVRRVNRHLNESFITPFEPETVVALCGALDDVLDAIEEAGFRLQFPTGICFNRDDLISAARRLQEGCDQLRQGIEAVACGFSAAAECMRIRVLEEEVDLFLRETLLRIFDLHTNPVSIICAKDAADAVEEVADRCADAADILENVSRSRKRRSLKAGAG